MFSRESLFGVDLDELFAYSTLKVVWIRDRWIGLIYYSLVFLVVAWALIGQILWRNEHFFRKDVTGLARMFHAYPTVGVCDPLQESCIRDRRDLSTLPYCDAYTGKFRNGQRAHCEYDTTPLVRSGGQPTNKLFIPTAVELMTERRECKTDAASCTAEFLVDEGQDCLHGKYLCKKRGQAQHQFYYVADVTSHQIRLTSSYERDSIRGTSLMHPAFVGTCPGRARPDNLTRSWTERKELEEGECHPAVHDWSLQKIRCAREQGVDCSKMRTFDAFANHSIGQDFNDFFEGLIHKRSILLDQGKVPRKSLANTTHPRRAHSFIQERAKLSRSSAVEIVDPGSMEDPAFRMQFSDPWGDVFSLGRLIQLAGADLDNDYNLDGWTTRQAGTALEVRVVYNNLYRLVSTFGYKPVEYHYEVNELLLPYMSRTVEMASSDPAIRRYEVQYGVVVDFKVGGQFGFFDLTYLILMITSALALTASATTVTDLIGLYLYPRKENFFHLKYEVSPDFSKAWTCTECGYLNDPSHTHCHRMPKWEQFEKARVCGVPRDRSEEAAGSGSKPSD